MGRAGGSLEAELPVLAKVAVDWDATAYSFLDGLMRQPGFREEMRAQLHPDTCDHWDHPMNLMGLDSFEGAHDLDVMRAVGVYPGFVQSMRQLQTMGYEPVILTHNSEQTLGNIQTYLGELGLDLAVQRARPAEKIAWCEENSCRVLVDDAPETMRLAAAVDLTVVAYRFLYNAEAIDETGALWVPQGSDWSALLSLVIGQLEPHTQLDPA